MLTDAEARHARQILRMRPGDRAELFDGAGIEVIAEVVGPDGQNLAFRVLEARTAAIELPIRVVMGGLRPGGRFSPIRRKSKAGLGRGKTPDS